MFKNLAYSQRTLPKFKMLAYAPGRSDFAISQLSNRYIYVTGGRDMLDKQRLVLPTCYRFDVKSNDFQTMPDMKHARENHSSAACGEKIAVFGGFWEYGQRKSIEVFRGTEWAKILAPYFTPRENPIVCALNNHLVLICGGKCEVDGMPEHLGDSMVLDFNLECMAKVGDISQPAESSCN